MNKIYFIDEILDKMGGVERIINTLSNDLVKKYDVELISLYKSNNETYFKYDDNIKINYIYKKSNLVSKKYPDWKLRIVGDGYYKPKMEELISDLNLNDNVLLVPATKDVVKELNKASIYVMASRFEGYANALVEAMACGLSCISYDRLMGVDEIIKHNEKGLIVNLTDRYRYFKTLDIIDEDINILADMIIKTIEDKNMREKFKNEAPKIVNSRKKDKIIEKWLKIVCEENYEEKNKN